jgi:RNase P subunit RPR2
MTCEKCHGLIIERPSISTRNEPKEEEAVVVLECTQCGHIEYQPLVTSFWRRLAA